MPSKMMLREKFLLFILWRHFCTFMSEKKKKNDYWCTHNIVPGRGFIYTFFPLSVFHFFLSKKKEVQGPVSLAVTVKGPPACNSERWLQGKMAPICRKLLPSSLLSYICVVCLYIHLILFSDGVSFRLCV